jgi:GAF domain-containing protein
VCSSDLVAVCGCVAEAGERIVAEDIFEMSDPRTELVKSYGIRAFACHPLMTRDKLIGTLSFGTKTRLRFTEQEISLMKTVSDEVAVAMERMKLIDMLKQSRDELEIRVRERTEELEKANTEKMAFQAEAMQYSHLASLGELAASVAHEINNPINGIINYAQILANQAVAESRELDISQRII